MAGSMEGPWFVLPYVFYEEATNSDWIYDAWYSYGEGAEKLIELPLEELNPNGKKSDHYIKCTTRLQISRVVKGHKDKFQNLTKLDF